jgi:outer membrane protein OmpA-like peptidoglycan-associated protein
MELPRQRAQAVKDWPVRNRNVLAAHIFTKSLGEEFAIAPNINVNGTHNPLGRR